MAKRVNPSAKDRGTKPKVRREFSAGFVVFRETDDGPKFLLLDYGKHWDYPKGHLEKGETAWEAAVRELHEETGIRKIERVGRFRHDLHYMFRSRKKGLISKTVTFFLGRTETKKVELSDEHEGYAWMEYAEALDRLTYANARQTLRAAKRSLK